MYAVSLVLFPKVPEMKVVVNKEIVDSDKVVISSKRVVSKRVINYIYVKV